MDGRRIRRVSHGDVLRALLDAFGLGGHVGRVCAVCIPQVGMGVFRVLFFERLCYLSAHRWFVKSAIRIKKLVTMCNEANIPIPKVAYFLSFVGGPKGERMCRSQRQLAGPS